MWETKSLWPIKGQAITTTKFGGFLAEFLSERQIWKRSPILGETLHITEKPAKAFIYRVNGCKGYQRNIA